MKKALVFLLLTFPAHSVFADYVAQDIKNACTKNALYRAVFQLKRQNCNNGYFLPANSESCETCPLGFNCPGGTYTFNETNAQGATYSSTITTTMNNICAINTPQLFRAVFNPKTINCPKGKYLTANSVVCNTDCLLNHYCPGGDYFFNETQNVGIFPCPEAHPFAPAGMWLESQCGRKLHVGEDILYMHQQPAHPTIHRLYIGHPNGIYSANAVQRDMNSNTFPKMSDGMSKGFHVTIDNVEYLICDDSVPECRND